MLGMTSFYDSNEHTIIGGEIGAFCDRLVDGYPQRKGKLFVVRYLKLGVFVIAEWLVKPKDIFIDVLNIGKSLGNFGAKEADELRKRVLAPLTAEGTGRQLIQADSDFHHGLQDENEEETERWERVARGE